MPRFLAVWLFINGAAYLIISFTAVLAPHYEARVFNLATPAVFGEMAFVLWLLIRGAVPPPASATPNDGGWSSTSSQRV